MEHNASNIIKKILKDPSGKGQLMEYLYSDKGNFKVELSTGESFTFEVERTEDIHTKDVVKITKYEPRNKKVKHVC